MQASHAPPGRSLIVICNLPSLRQASKGEEGYRATGRDGESMDVVEVRWHDIPVQRRADGSWRSR